MFLTPEEIADLTGIRRGRDGKTRGELQCDHLQKTGIKFYKDAKGNPVIPRASLEFNANESAYQIENSSDQTLEPFKGEVPIDWLHKNLNEYLFNKQHIISASEPYRQSKVAQMSGVYFLIDDESIVYVGISNNIAYRLSQHAASEKNFDRYWLIEFPVMMMHYLEAIYIHAINPHLNVDYPSIIGFEKYVEAIIENS